MLKRKSYTKNSMKKVYFFYIYSKLNLRAEHELTHHSIILYADLLQLTFYLFPLIPIIVSTTFEHQR